MADHTSHTDRTYVRETDVPRRSGGMSTLAFIVGGLLALVLVIAFFMWGDGVDNGTRTVVPADTSTSDVNVSVEAGAGAEADGDAAAAPAPATEDTAPVAEETPSPAD